MNSKQINFFIIPDDLQQIVRFLKQKRILVIKRNTSLPEIVDYDLALNSEKIFQVYLSKDEFKNKISLNYLNAKNHYYVDDMRSDVIEFSIGGFYPYSDKELHRSRLYFITKYYDDKGILVEKEPESIKWADEIFKDFKTQFLKKTPQYSGDYFSEKCLNWLKNNNAKLEKDGSKLVIT